MDASQTPATAQGAPLDLSTLPQSVFEGLLAAGKEFGGRRVALIDGDGRQFTYRELVRASLALGHALKRGTQAGETVGVLLPTGVGAIIAFFALSAYDRVPAMLNFTAGEACLRAALKAAQIGRIVTARRFVTLGKFEALVAALSESAEIIYLEDLRASLSLADKAAAFIGSLMPNFLTTQPQRNAPAVILFTSGTEGEPKGVVLSHTNLLANVAQVRAHLDLSPHTDILFNPLPVFHCFGLTVGSLMPLLLGIKTVCHPTPLQPREIVNRIHDTRSTILLSTDTFIAQYARIAEPGDLATLRLTVCGAERVREETRTFLRSKHAIELLEGYGVTETSPVAAANQPSANRLGTVGHLMPGMEMRLEPVEGIADGARLLLRGPNVMLGYIAPSRPGAIDPPPDGWHDTGDVVSVDADGYIAIRGRLKRFAKIGGEIVSLATGESAAGTLWPDHAHAAVAIPDGRKGEQIVLVTSNHEATRGALIDHARSRGMPELAIPRRIVHVETIPVLGTGKTDYVKLRQMVLTTAAADGAL